MRMQNARKYSLYSYAKCTRYTRTRNVLALLVREMYSLYSYAKCFLWKRDFTPLRSAHKEKNKILIRLSGAKRSEAVSNSLDFSCAEGAFSVPLGTFTAHKENYNKNHCERSVTERSPFCILHFAFCI